MTVLCLAEDPQALLAEACRVLQPGGRIVLGELGRYSPWALARRLKGLLRETVYRRARFFTRSELEEQLTSSGFRDVAFRSAVFYPPVNARVAIRCGRLVEPIGRRLAPWAGAFLAARAERPRAAQGTR